MSIEGRLTDFIRDEIAYDAEAVEIGRDVPLLEGILDSPDVLRLVVFVEEEFGLEVSDDEIVPENFATIASVTDFVRAKLER